MNVTNIPACRITTKCQTATYLELGLQFVYTDQQISRSPIYTINGVVNFDFKVEKKNNLLFLFVRFRRKRRNDILEYCITFKHWTNENMKFDAVDKWRYICSDTSGGGNISVNVDLKTLSRSYASLYEDTELTDFKLVGDDGYVFLHKAVLAAYSPFFKTMFCRQWKETTEGVIEVSGISKQTLEHFKEFMYLGTLPDSCAKYLLLLSKFYMMEDLENRCLFKLRAELTEKNIFELMEFAVANKHTRLLYEVLDITQEGNIDVDKIEEFLDYL